MSLRNYVKETHPKDFRWFSSHITYASWTNTIRELKAKFDYYRSSTFVFCTVGRYEDLVPENNLYMWGHYGNGHRGIAIEFDTQQLEKTVLLNTEKIPGWNYSQIWTKIDYVDDFSPINCEDFFEFFMQTKDMEYGQPVTIGSTHLERYYRAIGRVKSEIWSRENEWRLLWRNDTHASKIHQINISPDVISRIWMGMCAPEIGERRIIDAVRRKFPNVEIFKARKQTGKFSLCFDQV